MLGVYTAFLLFAIAIALGSFVMTGKWSSGLRNRELVFAVVGDIHGRLDVWTKVVEAINAVQPKPKFALVCGDLVASGTDAQYETLVESFKSLKTPYHAVPGNHDVRGNGAALFAQHVCDRLYGSFTESGVKFIALDTSTGSVDADQREWLRSELSAQGPKVVFMHVPLDDPREGCDHAFLDRTQADELHKAFAASNVLAVFSGHVHMYDEREREGVLYVTSGGAGGPLYAAPEAGGVYHFALVKVKGEDVSVEKRTVEAEIAEAGLKVIGPLGNLDYSVGDLMQMSTVEGRASFENKFGNLGGQGTYVGVPVSDLLEPVGGVSPGGIITVRSTDGYEQDYAYENVCPTPEWMELQGTMVLAFEKDGMTMPEWGEGPRVVFLSPDGIYHNLDCAGTSVPGQGWNSYQSAGARWARYVSEIEVK